MGTKKLVDLPDLKKNWLCLRARHFHNLEGGPSEECGDMLRWCGQAKQDKAPAGSLSRTRWMRSRVDWMRRRRSDGAPWGFTILGLNTLQRRVAHFWLWLVNLAVESTTNSASDYTLNFVCCWVRAKLPPSLYRKWEGEDPQGYGAFFASRRSINLCMPFGTYKQSISLGSLLSTWSWLLSMFNLTFSDLTLAISGLFICPCRKFDF